MTQRTQEVEIKRNNLLQMGGSKQIEKQHQAGKLTARERINLLLDPGTFQEIDLWVRPIKTGFDIDERELPGDAIVTGFGKIHDRPFYVISEDLTVIGGTFGSGFHHKISRIMEMAIENKIPYIQMIDSGGERIHELFGRTAFRPILGGRGAYAGSSSMYFAPSKASGVIPQITLMLGPSYAGSAYSPTMGDFFIMRKGTAFMSVASPQLLKTVTFKDVTQEEIGGSILHATISGIADFHLDTDEEVIAVCRDLTTYIPLNYMENAPIVNLGDDPNRKERHLAEISAEDKVYDMHEIIHSIVDQGKFLEFQEQYAKSLIIGFARLDGRTVGIVANNPIEFGGILTLNTCDKQARFIRWCDAFNIPLIFLVDTPGFLTKPDDEYSKDGLLRTVPKAIFAICEATVPMVSIYIGKGFGIGRMVMGTLGMGIDFAYAWPSSKVARVDPKDVVNHLYEKELEVAADRNTLYKEKLTELHNNYIVYPYHAAEQVMVNDIIQPDDTRSVLIKSLHNLSKKKSSIHPERKHNLMPQ